MWFKPQHWMLLESQFGRMFKIEEYTLCKYIDTLIIRGDEQKVDLMSC